MRSFFTPKTLPATDECPELMEEAFQQLPLQSRIQGMVAVLGLANATSEPQTRTNEILRRIRAMPTTQERSPYLDLL